MIDIQVSPQDVDLLGGWKVNKNVNKNGLLYRYVRSGLGYSQEFLHRLIAKRILEEKGLVLTHRVRVYFQDGIKTHCTRDNIVLADYATQGRLSARRKNKTSQYRGVYKDRNQWHVKVYRPIGKNGAKGKVKYKVEHLGFYPLDQEEEAARARDKRVRELHLDTVLNFPDEALT